MNQSNVITNAVVSEISTSLLTKYVIFLILAFFIYNYRLLSYESTVHYAEFYLNKVPSAINTFVNKCKQVN